VTRFTVVGNPGSRRVTMFAAAVRAFGLGDPHVVPWVDVLSGRAELTAGSLVRIDSPGEDVRVDRLLRGAGVDPCRVEGGAAWYRNFTGALRAIASQPDVRLLSDPDDIAVMFDKRHCHLRLREAGVAVPPALGEPANYAQLRTAMAEQGWSRVFVKPAHGSSASGVVALETCAGQVRATTSADLVTGPRLYNSLKVRTYTDEREVAALIDALCADHLHVEQWLPKAGLDGRTIDLRVVVVDGRATHAVVRASRTPLTNLHLGNARGDLDEVRRRLADEGWHRVLGTCEQAAAVFPRSLMVGVDVLIGVGWRRHAVCEVNAFGDLLPGLTGFAGGGAENLGTYATQVRAAIAERRALNGRPGTGR
jgi:glutathione synthase/RimK-type ligase-like ATP-grasp enzyme